MVKNIKNDKSFQKIKQLAKSLNEFAVQAVTEYSPEVDTIIASRCRDKQRIEHTLDGMLDFCFDKNMLQLYRKFCRYYYGINPSEAVEYVNAYRNMWAPTLKEMHRAVEGPTQRSKK